MEQLAGKRTEALFGSRFGGPGVPTSPKRRYLISYLRMRPLGSGGSSQRRRTLLLLAASQATFPGMPSASPAGEGTRQPSPSISSQLHLQAQGAKLRGSRELGGYGDWGGGEQSETLEVWGGRTR